MVVTNNDITQKNYKKLSIQVSLSGLSFCVFDLLTNTVITIRSFVFQENSVLEEQLWKVFSQNAILNENYDQIVVLHNNHLNTFVPQSLFSEDFLGSYLQYNVKVFESDLFTFDTLKQQEINNVYVPYININNFLLDQYSSFNYQHSTSILVEKLSKITTHNFEKQVFAHLNETSFELIVLLNGKLLFFNSFETKTPEDFIYYVLFSFEQLQLNPDNCSFHFLGKISKEHEYFKIAYKYIRNSNLYPITDLAAQFKISETEAIEHFTILHS